MAAKKAPAKRKGAVAKAVDHDLKQLPPIFRNSALAASARVLATSLDDPKNSATSKSMCAKALIDTLDRLRELAPAPEEDDKLDDLSARRAARRAGRSAA